jgi:hypothetical protein
MCHILGGRQRAIKECPPVEKTRDQQGSKPASEAILALPEAAPHLWVAGEPRPYPSAPHTWFKGKDTYPVTETVPVSVFIALAILKNIDCYFIDAPSV